MTEPHPILPDAAYELHDDASATISSTSLAAALDQLGLPLDELSVRMLAGELGLDRSEFEIRIGEWRLNTSVAAARALVNGVVLTTVLAARGETSIPATVLSVVVPLVFDLDRITISPSDRALYVDLLRKAPDRAEVEDWYADLSDHIRAEVTLLEFRDLIERLDDAGLVESDPFNVVTVDPPSERRRRRLSLP